jgi:FlaA1/EpsC-like NDP-sugar epimerase
VGDLVERFIEAVTPAGKRRVGIDVIGLRPGEKMREELTTQGLAMQATAHPRIWAARERLAESGVAASVRKIRRAVADGDAVASLVALELAVEDFSASDAAWAAANIRDMFDLDDQMGQAA